MVSTAKQDCLVCHRPFSSRRKWTHNWPQVRLCSERYRSQLNAEETLRSRDEC
ncbi:DUF2256 domain-containing protein [Alphaproteobacteria bacterium]|nr:DUF2256 domain-containing protein [Alphaproteobacteria bacterium]